MVANGYANIHFHFVVIIIGAVAGSLLALLIVVLLGCLLIRKRYVCINREVIASLLHEERWKVLGELIKHLLSARHSPTLSLQDLSRVIGNTKN